MKFVFGFISLFFLTFSGIEKVYAQNMDRNSIFKCASVFGDSITFLNDFTVDNPKRKTKDEPNGQEWNVYLMKGTVYRFALCCFTPGKDIEMKLYDDTVTEQHPYNVLKQKKKTTYFDYVCKRSDIYKVSIRFRDNSVLNKELKAIGLLGFVRKIK